MKPKTIVILILVVILAIVLIQNSGLVEFRLLFWHVYGPLFFLVLGVFAVGLLIGYLAAKVDRKKRPKPSSAPVEREAKPAPVSETKPGSPTAP
jgi:uncharacterized membrane protein YciS (DUF1049 family)